MRFDPKFWEELKAKNNIVEVIGSYIPLTKRAGAILGVLPFPSRENALVCGERRGRVLPLFRLRRFRRRGEVCAEHRIDRFYDGGADSCRPRENGSARFKRFRREKSAGIQAEKGRGAENTSGNGALLFKQSLRRRFPCGQAPRIYSAAENFAVGGEKIQAWARRSDSASCPSICVRSVFHARICWKAEWYRLIRSAATGWWILWRDG